MSSALASYSETKKDVVRVDLARPTQVGKTLMHPTPHNTATPFHKNLKTISHYNFKPHVKPIRTDFVRHSHQTPLVLPKLITPGRNRSTINKT